MLADTKINPLWQSPVLPLPYLIAAVFCGLGFTIFPLMIVCLRYARNLDDAVLEELANLLSGVCFVFLVVRIGDLIRRHEIPVSLAFDRMSFLFESTMILAPAMHVKDGSLRSASVGFAQRSMGLPLCVQWKMHFLLTFH